MSLVTGLMIYAILWWLVLFMVLPFGVRTVREEGGEVGEGEAASAPARPRIALKMLVTTIVSGVVMGLFLAGMNSGLIDLRGYFAPSR